jgi:hypothetical protein
VYFTYTECVKKFLGACTKKELKRKEYDLADPATRSMFISMGFVFQVREKPGQ